MRGDQRRVQVDDQPASPPAASRQSGATGTRPGSRRSSTTRAPGPPRARAILSSARGSASSSVRSEYNLGPAAELLPHGGEVIGFCSWREGLVLRPDVADGVFSVSDVARQKLRLVNREPGAEARRLLDRELSAAGIDAGQLPGYGTQGTGHLQVAAAISAGLADAGIASEPAALAWPSFRSPPNGLTSSSRPTSRYPRSAGLAEDPLVRVAAQSDSELARI